MPLRVVQRNSRNRRRQHNSIRTRRLPHITRIANLLFAIAIAPIFGRTKKVHDVASATTTAAFRAARIDQPNRSCPAAIHASASAASGAAINNSKLWKAVCVRITTVHKIHGAASPYATNEPFGGRRTNKTITAINPGKPIMKT